MTLTLTALQLQSETQKQVQPLSTQAAVTRFASVSAQPILMH